MYEQDMRHMITALEEKNKEIAYHSSKSRDLQVRKEVLESQMTHLQNENKKKDVEIRDLRGTLNEKIQNIEKKTRAIEGKIDCMSTRSKLLYSETVKSTNNLQDAIILPSTQAGKYHDPNQTINVKPSTMTQDAETSPDKQPTHNRTGLHEDDNNTEQARSVEFNGQWKRAFTGISH